jgi:hypothetical protein
MRIRFDILLAVGLAAVVLACCLAPPARTASRCGADCPCRKAVRP